MDWIVKTVKNLLSISKGSLHPFWSIECRLASFRKKTIIKGTNTV